MAKKPKSTISRAFMVMEATSANGGFSAYMNMLMADMELKMQNAECYGPYKWSFGGGDGYAVPVTLICSTC